MVASYIIKNQPISRVNVCLHMNFHPETLRRYNEFLFEMYPDIYVEEDTYKVKPDSKLLEAKI